ncbi:hypothetical protein FKM82_023282 [Ascaphus truei]
MCVECAQVVSWCAAAMCTGTVGRPLQRENEGTGGHCFYRNVKARHSMSVRRECRGAAMCTDTVGRDPALARI